MKKVLVNEAQIFILWFCCLLFVVCCFYKWTYRGHAFLGMTSGWNTFVLNWNEKVLVNFHKTVNFIYFKPQSHFGMPHWCTGSFGRVTVRWPRAVFRGMSRWRASRIWSSRTTGWRTKGATAWVHCDHPGRRFRSKTAGDVMDHARLPHDVFPRSRRPCKIRICRVQWFYCIYRRPSTWVDRA